MGASGTRERMARAGGALALVVLAALLPRLAGAAEAAGRVIFGVGETVAVAADGSERALGRGDDVHVGETLVTGPAGRVQVRFDDGALLDLKPGSRFGLDEYREPAGDEGGSVLMRLFRGAMRTITGAIGRGADDEYRVDTPVATIGIRGTEYSLQYCDSDCASDDRALGLYGRTDDGSIRVSNAHGTTGFDAGQYFFVPAEGPPELLLTPPAGVLDGLEDGRTGRPGGDEDGRVPGGITIDRARAFLRGLDLDGDRLATLFKEAEDRGDEARTRIRLDGALFAGAVGGGGTARRTLFESTSTEQVWIDGGGAVIEADFVDPQGTNLGTLDVTGTRLAEFGSTTAGDADVAWGRWAGALTQADGTTLDGGFSFAYLDARDLTDPVTLGTLAETPGTITYDNPAGPLAVDQVGGLWHVDTLSLTANFTTAVIGLVGMQISSVSGDGVINFGATAEETPNIELQANSFSLITSNGLESLNLNGRFLGTNAEGTLVIFQIDSAQGAERPTIVGTQIVTE